MRPYKRHQHASWRIRGSHCMWERIKQYLQPFITDMRLIWEPDPPFPPSVRMLATMTVWLFLGLPLLYFLVPPLLTLLTLQVILNEFCWCKCYVDLPFPLIKTLHTLLLTNISDYDKSILRNMVKVTLKRITFQVSLAVACYDYVQTFRTLGFG